MLEEVEETRHSIARIRVGSSANLTAVKLPVVASMPPANLEQSDPLSLPPLPTFKGRDTFTIIRRRR